MTDTYLAQAVEAANDLSTYDTNVKFLLADKQILARVLKYAVQEFKDMTIEDIMDSIGDDIDVGTKPLDAGLSNIGRVNATNTEDNIPGEGKIFFDIRFTAYHKETEMKFLINLEAQKSSKPSKLGYHLCFQINKKFHFCLFGKQDSILPCQNDLCAEADRILS